MAGHSKWHNIKHKKAIIDAKRGKVFTKMSKLITVAVKEAGGDASHPSVLVAVEKAKKYSVPKDNIDRAIKKGQGGEAGSMEQITYEGYGPGGVGYIIEVVTDNRNRSAQEIKHAFSKLGYSMGVPGSVSWGFSKNDQGEWEANAGTEIPVGEADEAAVEQLMDDLQDLDDVTDVFINAG